jgi:hypothetical protein
MLKHGLVALLVGLLIFCGTPITAAASQQACAMMGSDCCCGTCHSPAKSANSCFSCAREKANPGVLTTQVTVKPRINFALYHLPQNKPTDVRPLFAQYVRGLDTSPPSGGSAHQALLRLWLI